MNRIQFYPSSDLAKRLESDAKKNNVSISTWVVEILQRYYGITPQPTLNLKEATDLVLREVEEYINNIEVGCTFDLLTASKTFRQVEMTVKGKPSTNRASLGKIFSSRIGKAPFDNISFSYKPDGKSIMKSENKATLYKKVSDNNGRGI